MTCADADYFHFLPYFEANIERKFGRLPLIYDLGLTADQRARSRPRSSRRGHRRLQGPEPARGFIMSHPQARLHRRRLDRTGEGCLYVDADVLFVGPLTGADLGDARHRRHAAPPEGATALHLANGAINTGVLYFSRTPAARALVDTWTAACAVGDRTDQKALSDLLAGFAILGPPRPRDPRRPPPP